MSIFITKIKLYNFRRFREFVIEPNTKNNILIGDNESGKSTILEAIDLVSGGNNRRVEAIGLDNLLNIEAVTEFINSDRCYADLPKLRVELYLSGASDPSVNGENNSDKIECDGIKLVCEPNEDYKTEITFAMDAQSDYFPYEYYSIRFSTFADQVYTGYKRKLRCSMVNSDNMDSEYANSIVKLHYQNGSKKGYMHKNWGETKGEDKYTDVCVLLNKTTSKKMAAGKLAELAPMTKNKLYVAITRAKGNVYIFDE